MTVYLLVQIFSKNPKKSCSKNNGECNKNRCNNQSINTNQSTN